MCRASSLDCRAYGGMGDLIKARGRGEYVNVMVRMRAWATTSSGQARIDFGKKRYFTPETPLAHDGPVPVGVTVGCRLS
jgi:hypothetical protein